MSTPTSKLPNSDELSFAPRWARESKPAEGQARPIDSLAHDPHASPYVPKRRLARSSRVPDAPGLTEPSFPSRGMHPSCDTGQPVGHQGESVDLERLEAALRSLQREAAAARFQPPLLEPERIASPPARAPRYTHKRLLASLLAAAAVPLIYYLSADSLVSASTPVAPSPLVTLQQRFDAVQSSGQGETKGIGSRERAPAISIAPSISPVRGEISEPAPTPA